jgi:hypothetical protein
MRRWIVAALALLPAACGRLSDTSPSPDATHTLALYEHKEGDVYRVARTKMSETDATATAGHRGMSDKVVVKEKVVFTEELLEKPAGATRATRLRRTYEAVDKSHSKTGAQKSALMGKVVEVDRTGAKPRYTIDGRSPTPEQAKELDADFGREQTDTLTNADMLPGKPVKVGETWAVDRAKVAASLPQVPAVKFEADHVRVSGKLVSVTPQGGKSQAKVEFTLRMPVAEIRPDNLVRPLKTDAESSLVITVTVEFCPDGSTPGEIVYFDGRGRVGADLPNGGLFTMHYHETGTTSEEMPPKK